MTYSLNFILTLLIFSSAFSDDFTSQKETLQKTFPDRTISRVSQSPIPGLLEVTVGADIYYASLDGRYFLQAEIFDLGSL